MLIFDGGEKLHSLSIIALENIPHPILAARYLLINSAKLLNIWYEIWTLIQERLKDFLSLLITLCNDVEKKRD